MELQDIRRASQNQSCGPELNNDREKICNKYKDVYKIKSKNLYK